MDIIPLPESMNISKEMFLLLAIHEKMIMETLGLHDLENLQKPKRKAKEE